MAELRAAQFPKMVISGGHSDAFEAVSDAISDFVGARRERVEGMQHGVPLVGAPYNALLHELLLAARSATE